MMKTIQIEDGKGGFVTPPMHAVVYNLSSAMQKNDKGSWYGWSITRPNHGSIRQRFVQKCKSVFLTIYPREPCTSKS